MPLIAPQGGWIVIHPCSTALSSPKARLATYMGQAPAALERKSCRAGLEVFLWGGLSRGWTGARWCGWIPVNHRVGWRHTQAHSKTSQHVFLIFSSSQSATHLSSHCHNENGFHFHCNFVQEQWAEQKRWSNYRCQNEHSDCKIMFQQRIL